ncbi:MAG: GTP-binding protein, partial [Halomonas sp.]
ERQVVTRKLQAPLQKHLNHYLRLIFPGATLSVDDNLLPQALIRTQPLSNQADEHGELAALSFGAREQMGLVSRLAYADLLREAGRPTLIILDDALVHCDRERLEQMKRILFDAAQRHQILLFTCHPQHWDDLGVAPRDLVSLKRASSG